LEVHLGVRLPGATHRNLYVGSERAGQRVRESVTHFITHRLKLKVNQAKSAVAQPRQRKFLGFSFTSEREPPRRIAPRPSLCRMPTLLTSGFHPWSRGLSLIRRTAVCGPACTVVWQGRRGDPSPYADSPLRSKEQILLRNRVYRLSFLLIASALRFSCISSAIFCSFAASGACPSSRNTLPRTKCASK